MFELNLAASAHPIKSVTVFKSKAEIVRTFALDLKSGQNKVEISDLPSAIDANSVRVSGLGDARLFDVVCTSASASEQEARAGDKNASSETARMAESIRQLEAKKLSLESQRRVLEYQAELLLSYAKTLTGEHVAPTAMTEFLGSFVEQGRKNLEATAELEEQCVDVNRQIATIKHNLASRKGFTTSTVVVVIGAADPTHIELKLTYIVANASWSPTYELHATTTDGKTTSSIYLHYRAKVTQSTGEDWADTSLTLSTVALDAVNQVIPQPLPIKVKPSYNGFNTNGGNMNTGPKLPFPGGLFGSNQPAFGKTVGFGASGDLNQLQQRQYQQLQVQQPQPQQQQQQLQPAATGTSAQLVQMGALFGGNGAAPPPPAASPSQPAEDEAFEEIALPGALSKPHTVVSETPLAISYSVDNEVSIPTDGHQHVVSIALLPFDAKISHVVVPRAQPRVYLQREVKNTSDYRLLPGPVSVIMDDSFVSNIKINEINKGDTFACTLGTDLAAKVTYSRTVKNENPVNGTFSESSNIAKYHTKMTLHNQHTFAIEDLIVREALPTSADKRGRVILREPAGLANSKHGDIVKLPDGASVMWSKTGGEKNGEELGLFSWRWKVDAGEKVTLEAKWEVHTPAHETWVEFLQA
ncbi:hypothetical protein HGRIS_010456 [Hohenbuehelia grisea]|uniref:Protein F37C4.5 n=1 Tax=Hohenbuehelia grisea TaxID=104357 RepID=A0ABR3IZ51_9AGAR